MAAIRVRVRADASGIAGLVSAAKTRRMTTQAVKAGARIVQRAAKAAAPRRAGALQQSMWVKAAPGRRGKTVAYAVVGPRKAFSKEVPHGSKVVKAVPANYAHLVERGTRPHSLGRGAKLGRRGKRDAGQSSGPRHPGAKPHPFLGPAWESNTGAVALAMNRKMAEQVDREIKKLAVKVGKLSGG